MQQYYSNGKLLLTAEYFVLEGAKALAVACKYGQSLQIKHQPKLADNTLHWLSKDVANNTWLDVHLHINTLSLQQNNTTSTADVAQKLVEILQYTRQLNSSFLPPHTPSIIATTQLNFPRNWGLGSSSTLINNIAQWAQVDAFKLQFAMFGGSAYDIACAKNSSPIIYQKNGEQVSYTKVKFAPPFKQNIYFIHLGKKQNSRTAIQYFKSLQHHQYQNTIRHLNDITNALLSCNDLHEFIALIEEHENIIATQLRLNKVKDLYFPDFKGAVKSLGAWGGDFCMAVGNYDKQEAIQYFKRKGYKIVKTYSEMVL